MPQQELLKDVVVEIQGSAVNKLVEAFPAPDFFLDKESIRDALKGRGMFNLLNVNEGDKVDFWLLKDEPFALSCFSRKIQEEFMGIKLFISTPEDTILSKLKWAKECGGSEKQFIDALRVYELQFKKLDMNYLERWVKELGVESMWQRLKVEAKIVQL